MECACVDLPVVSTAAVVIPESSRCRSCMKSLTVMSMGLRKKRHVSLLEGSGRATTGRPCLYCTDTSTEESRRRGTGYFNTGLAIQQCVISKRSISFNSDRPEDIPD